MARLKIALPVFFLYIMLSSRSADEMQGHAPWPNLVFGILLSFGISLLYQKPSGSFNFLEFIKLLLGLAYYVGFVFIEMIMSAIQVAKIVLDPKLPIAPGIIAIDSGCHNEMATALSAYAITLTPGEMVVAMDENGIMYTHTLNLNQSEESADSQQIERRQLLSKFLN